jgi:O-antigen/teichoic acid export membrane protein
MKPVFQILSMDLVKALLMALPHLLLIRVMGEGEYAVYTFALAWVGVLTQTLASSFNVIYIVGDQRLELRGPLSSFVGFQLLALLGVGMLTFPFRDRIGNVYPASMVLVLAHCLSELARAFYQKDLRFWRFSVLGPARALVFFLGVGGVVLLAGEEVGALPVLLVQAVASASVFAIVLGRWIRPVELLKLKAPARFVWYVLRGEYRYLFGYFLFLGFCAQVDKFMLRILSDDRHLAAYGAAERYYGFLIMAVLAVHAVFLPVIRKAREASEVEALAARHRRLWILFAAGVLLLAWGAEWFMPWVDKGRYPESVAVFRVFCVSALLSFAFSPYVNLVMRFEDFGFLFVQVALAFPMGVLLHSLLIPRGEALGAAWATLLVYAFINGSTYLRARRHRRAWRQAGVLPP